MGAGRRRCALGLCALALLSASQARADCNPKPIGTAAVRAVDDGGTVVLADGRTVRLAGIVPHGASATAEIAGTLGAGPVELGRLGPERDRYGRLPALVRPEASGEWLQLRLLRLGLARVAARVGDKDCAAAFLHAERTARAGGLGIWSDAAYVIVKAENPGDVAAQRGRFTVVEGRVLSVREAGGTIYLNFGRRWSEDFTVTVLKRNERRFSAAGLDLRNLGGRRVRVRGTVEEQGGPWIEATRPEQIEVAGSD